MITIGPEVTAVTSASPTRRRFLTGLLALIIGAASVLAPLLVSSPAYADDSGGDLKAQKSHIDQLLATASATYEAAGKKVRAAAEAYEEATAAIPAAQNRLADAKGSVIAATSAVHVADRSLATAQTRAQVSQNAVVAANAQVEAGRSELESVVASAYEGDKLIQLDSLMSGGSPSLLLDRLTFMDHVAKDQSTSLDGYVALRMQAKDALNAAVADQKAAAAAQQLANAALTRSKQAVAAAQQASDDLAALATKRQEALAVAKANKAATLRQYEALQKQSKQIEEQLKALADEERKKAGGGGKTGGGSGSVTATGEFFVMPVLGWKSSNFGMRYDPFYHRWQLHAGVDIAAAGGTPIRAAAAGRVVRAGWAGGYGNYTCISHGLYQGQGLATCYGHQSKILVHVGEHVSRGQIIGRVGETGAATGYHLHFEVRINGKAVQPLNWLPKCFC